ncbi:ZNF816-ZNF321 protein, partial [Daubentonia madagascariensis]
ISSKCVIKELPPTGKSTAGEIFHTVMLERHESHPTGDFCFMEIQKYARDFEFQWRDNEQNYNTGHVTRKENFTGSRDQCDTRDARNKPNKNQLGLSFQSHPHELSMFQAEGKNQVEKSINSGSSGSTSQRISSRINTHIANQCGNDFIYSSLLIQKQKALLREKRYKCT